MAEGKWIPGLLPSTSLEDAARKALAVRLDVVAHFLPLAVSEPDKDVEYVHQLRVGTRRAVAALDIFALCLPKKLYKKARRRLRDVRRAAGAARDGDVFLAGLRRQRGKAARQGGAELLLGYALGQRIAAQERLAEFGPEAGDEFKQIVAETVAGVRRAKSEKDVNTLSDLARPMLLELFQQLNKTAAADLGDYANLHRVRIAGKRLRYAMEIFGHCFAAPFRDRLYPAVEEMQEILGNANDSHGAGQRLIVLREKLQAVRPRGWDEFKPALEAVLSAHQRRLPRERGRFLRWWKDWQELNAEAELSALLKSHAH